MVVVVAAPAVDVIPEVVGMDVPAGGDVLPVVDVAGSGTGSVNCEVVVVPVAALGSVHPANARETQMMRRRSDMVAPFCAFPTLPEDCYTV